MERKTDALDILKTINTLLSFVVAFLCALNAFKCFGERETAALRRGIVWLVTSAVWLAGSIVRWRNQEEDACDVLTEEDMDALT